MEKTDFVELFGFDIFASSFTREYVRARQAAMRMLAMNNYSQTKIGKLFGCTRQNVAKSLNKFQDYVEEEEKWAVKYWPIVIDHWEDFEE